ncbi:MAG: electron transport complex subunit RsxC [Oscillospiraceae bacterium]|nr:electron transport complex subunit RsxC [Oscillospiraceae bacterium]
MIQKATRFPGGIHPHGAHKSKLATAGKPLERAPVPDRLTVPLAQHIGAPAKLLVQKGDALFMGQLIGSAAGRISANIHSPVSGRVLDIVPCVMPNGLSVTAVLIDNDYKDTPDPSITPTADPFSLTPDEIRQKITDAGIVGMGGASFPTSVKLSLMPGSTVDTLVVNGAECEPYLTVDHRIMLENARDVIDGAKLAAKAVGAGSIVIGVEDNKPDAIEALRKAAGSDVKVVSLPEKYPQGGEKQLVYALTGRVIPAGGLPAAVNCAVMNVSTAAQVAVSVRTGMPLIERGITVTGLVKEPKNLVARIGTQLSELVLSCGGLLEGTKKIILGGPMMGVALARLEVPLIKSSSGLLAADDSDMRPEAQCIRCGRCSRACPMLLVPQMIDAYARKNMWDESKAQGAQVCIECGACTYVCPAKRQLTQSCRTAKKMIALTKK